ncbi:hypothetical protein [Roseibacillus persicicus]|uniref:hypothetical protein n=1 Tax=Roseibacillus persicicus TaxID=454148 RepID=UPI00398A8BFC
MQANHNLDKAARTHLKTEALRGTDIVPGAVSLCAMNLSCTASARPKTPTTRPSTAPTS